MIHQPFAATSAEFGIASAVTRERLMPKATLENPPNAPKRFTECRGVYTTANAVSEAPAAIDVGIRFISLPLE